MIDRLNDWKSGRQKDQIHRKVGRQKDERFKKRNKTSETVFLHMMFMEL